MTELLIFSLCCVIQADGVVRSTSKIGTFRVLINQRTFNKDLNSLLSQHCYANTDDPSGWRSSED